jgi:prepilin-type N-terminal cleavage/methylation domain-containing protein
MHSSSRQPTSPHLSLFQPRSNAAFLVQGAAAAPVRNSARAQCAPTQQAQGRAACKRRTVRGFSLIELMIVLMVGALLSVFTIYRLTESSEQASAAGLANYIKSVADAAQRHTLINFNELGAGTDIPGTANDLAPTIPELKTLGRLPTAFPPTAPGALGIRVDITKTNCPGVNCILTASACTATVMTLRGRAREDLASDVVAAMAGTGGRSMVGDGARVRGAAFNMPNPVGNVEGVVCGQSIVDTALFNRFVTINDTRDPNLLGKLTVAGDMGTNGGVAGCLRAALLGTGSLQAKSANCVVRTEMDSAGNITSRDAVGTARAGLRFSAAGVAEAYAESVVLSGAAALNTACATENALVRTNAQVGLLMCQSGLWRVASGAQQVSAGAVCSPEGARAVDAAGADMLCLGGTWQAITSIIRAGTAGTSCTVEGSTAIDFASGDQLLCRQNPAVAGLVLMRLRDITQHLQFVSSTDVKDGDIVLKPTCTSVAGIVTKPILQLIFTGGTSPNGGMSIYSQDSANSWTVRLRDGAGGVLTGNPNAIARADVYCYFG